MKITTAAKENAIVTIFDEVTNESYTWEGEASPSEVAAAYAASYKFDENEAIRIRMEFTDGDVIWGSLSPDGEFDADGEAHF